MKFFISDIAHRGRTIINRVYTACGYEPAKPIKFELGEYGGVTVGDHYYTITIPNSLNEAWDHYHDGAAHQDLDRLLAMNLCEIDCIESGIQPQDENGDYTREFFDVLYDVYHLYGRQFGTEAYASPWAQNAMELIRDYNEWTAYTERCLSA